MESLSAHRVIETRWIIQSLTAFLRGGELQPSEFRVRKIIESGILDLLHDILAEGCSASSTAAGSHELSDASLEVLCNLTQWGTAEENAKVFDICLKDTLVVYLDARRCINTIDSVRRWVTTTV